MVERSMTRSSSSEQGGGLSLPPGFRFHPTDEEVITSYLLKKFLRPSFVSRAVGEVDLNNCEPRDLPSKAKMGEKEWYFFVHKDMKYPTGMRTNRATREGYWKATGKDREIFSSTNTKNKNPRAGAATAGELVGMKKTLVFYTGRAPRGAKTNWVMHEFRLDGKSRDQTVNNPKDEWVVCKVFNKKGEARTTTKAAVDVDVDVECSAGTTTPNASSVVDAGEGAGDFLDSMYMIDPLYFTNSEYSSSFLPVKTTTTTSTNAAAPPPYNGDYYHYSVPTTAGSFNGAMPNYSLTNVTNQSHMQQQAAAVAKPVLPASGGGDIGSSWNILNPAGHGMERSSSYNVNHLHHHQDEHQAVMVKALGGDIGPNFGVSMGLPSSAAAIAGAPLQSKLESYDGEYAYGNYDLAGAAAAVNGRPAATAAKNFGARLLHY